jgi:hypothetical protein
MFRPGLRHEDAFTPAHNRSPEHALVRPREDPRGPSVAWPISSHGPGSGWPSSGRLRLVAFVSS